MLECGLHQSSSNSFLDSYKINSEKFKFNPTEIDYVFLCHAHIDHSGLLPRLCREGFNGKIISTGSTATITKSLLKNSAYILQDESKILSKRYKHKYPPVYEESDVYKTLDHFYICNRYNETYTLDDVVSFKWLRNSHCVGASQLVLILDNGNKRRKILYSSDIGALETKNHYVDKTELYNDFIDITIMESTYGNGKSNKKTRKFDLEHLRVAIDTVLGRGGSVVLPAFSFSRTQELLTEIYDLFGKNESFGYDVVVDSKLSCEICNLYTNILTGIQRQKWNEVLTWKNVRLITEKKESQECIADTKPKICISSSGFCTNGRIINYLTRYLRDEKSMIIFSGFTGDNPSYLSYKIQNYKEHKTININKKPIPNRADCITLSTMSSHAGFSDLIKYGSDLCTNRLILVHGSRESKENLKNSLEKEISKNNKSYKVTCSVKDMVVHL